MPIAKSYYRTCEEKLNINILNRRIILRGLQSVHEINDWDARSVDANYSSHMRDTDHAYSYSGFLKQEGSTGAVLGLQIDIPRLILAFRSYFEKLDVLQNQSFEYANIVFEGDQAAYKEKWYDAIIFADGWRGENNPFFQYLPFNPSKGELLIIEIDEKQFDEIYKSGIFIAPLGMNKYWVGASNEWHTKDPHPTQEKRKELIDKLERIIGLDYRIIDHKAAIRPTVKDRRPFIGRHSEIPCLYIFNGFGTKGSSLIPYWANHFKEFLIAGESLDPEVDIQRFAMS